VLSGAFPFDALQSCLYQLGFDSCRWHHGWKTHIAAAFLGVALTALFIVLTIVDTGRRHSSRRAIWLGVLMGVAFDTLK